MSDGPPATNSFELSRIHGQGWNAAKKLLASAKGDVDPAEAAPRNPYRAAEERAHWTKGFVAALGSRAIPFTRAGGNIWRPAVAGNIPGGESTT